MRVLGKEQQQFCPCYKAYQEFQKLVELEDSGLIIYWHRTHTEDTRQGDQFEPAVSTSKDVFIIQNKTDVKITTSKLALELEKNKISCPRCRKAFEHAQELMQEGKSIEKNIIMGICDHCRKKAQTIKNRLCACNEIVKKFINVKGEQKEDIRKYVKIWLSKIGHIKEGKSLNKSRQIKPGTYSDLQFKRDLKSPAPSLKLEIQQMFYSDKLESSLDSSKEIGKSDIKVHIKQDVSFVQPTELGATSLSHTRRVSENIYTFPSPSLVDSDTTFVEAHERVEVPPKPSLKHHKQEEAVEKVPSEDAKDALKRRHDLSLRQMMRREKDSGIPFSVHKRPDVYETPKVAPWEQEQHISKYVDTSKYHVKSDTDIKIPIKIKHDGESPRGQTKRPKYGSSKTSEDSSRDSNLKSRKNEKYSQKKIEKDFYDSEEKPKKGKKLDDHFIVHTKVKSRSDSHKMKKEDQHGIKSKKRPESSGTVVTPQYSFFFSKDKVKKKKQNLTKLNVTSSHLINVTKEKFRLQAERKKEEEENQKKLAQEAKKQRLQAEGKKEKEESQQTLAQEAKKQRLQTEGKKEKEESQQTLAQEAKKQRLQAEGKQEEEKSQQKLAQEAKNQKKSQVIENPEESEYNLTEKSAQFRDIKMEKQKAESKKGTNKLKVDTSKEGQRTVSMSKIQKLISKEQKGMSKSQQVLTKSEAATIKLKDDHLKKEEAALRKTKPEYGAAKKMEPIESEPKEIGIEMKNIQTKKKKSDHQILKLIGIKQAANLASRNLKLGKADSDKISKPPVFYVPTIAPPQVKCHHIQSGQYSSVCSLCLKELESDTLSFDSKKNVPMDKTDIIIGEKIFKYIPRLEKTKEPESVATLFEKDFYAESNHELNKIQIIPQEPIPPLSVMSKKDVKELDPTSYNGTRYALSDRSFIEKGWTMLPTEKIVRKMNIYRMRPAHPEFDWFEHNKSKGLMTYDTGERLAEFDDNGRGRWYYRNGRLALDYYDAEETNSMQRVVIYSSGEPDERGRTHPITILATFDHSGNGIVFDHAGKIRLKYNQNEGVVLDRAIGPVSHWQWHSLNDPPVLQQVMIDTQMAHKDPDILNLGNSDVESEPDNEEMLAIEFDNFIKEKNKKLSQKFKPFQIKMKALKINEHFSLKVLDQATVYLIFRDGLTNLKLNIGMILDHQEIVDTVTAEIGEVSNSLERFPARTDSLANLQRSVAHAQLYERQHAKRERRLHFLEPCASVDLMTAAASPPMRLPLRTVPTGSSSYTGYSSRKPPNNLYYDSRLVC